MSSVTPDFCYYKALSVEKTATPEQIVSAYRTLARIHHPDKNPNDSDATARFQRIQAAHETLSDPETRQRYDHLMTYSPGSTTYDPVFEEDEREGFESEFEEDDDEFTFFTRHGASYRNFDADPGFGFREWERQTHRARKEREEALERLQAEIRRRAQAEQEKKASMLRQQKEWERQQREESAKAAFQERERAERAVQEKIWADKNAQTEADKQHFCLHSAVWTKQEKHAKKFRCEACDQKRSVVVFQCPHCALQCCQICVTQFKARRERLGSKK